MLLTADRRGRAIPIDSIYVPEKRMRALRDDALTLMVESLRDSGQLQPIVVRPAGDGNYWLVAGLHRLEGAKRLEWPHIVGVVHSDMSADQALLAEIDENLMRAELSPAEQASHMAARKAVYTRLHPETRSVRIKGGPGRKGVKSTPDQSQDATERTPAFIDKTAQSLGRDRSTVARAVARGEAIPDVEKLAGTSLDKGTELDALAGLPKERREKLTERAIAGEKVSAKTEAKKVKRDEREVALAERSRAAAASLGVKKYGVIMADPPWQFEPWGPGGMDRAADNHYPTMSTDALCAMSIADITEDDCVLFIWATVPMMPDALDVMDAWGFTYRSHWCWMKNRAGTGYWGRNQHELLLIGTRGNPPAPAPGQQPASVTVAPVSRHSAKPEIFATGIKAMFPNMPAVELFSRRPQPGFDAWGNEAPVATEVAAQ